MDTSRSTPIVRRQLSRQVDKSLGASTSTSQRTWNNTLHIKCAILATYSIMSNSVLLRGLGSGPMHAIYIETSGSPLRYNCHRLFPGLRVTIRFLTHVQASHASIGAPSCRDMHLLFARERERERLSANFLSYNQLRSWQCNLYIKKKTLQYTQ